MSRTRAHLAPLLPMLILLLWSSSAIAQDGRLRIYVRPAPEGDWAKDRADSVKDLSDALRKAKWAVLARSPEAVDLEIEITGRRARQRPDKLPPPMPTPRPGGSGQPMYGNRSELAVYATVRLATDPAGLHTYDLVGTSRGYRWKGCADDLIEQLEGWTAEGPPGR